MGEFDFVKPRHLIVRVAEPAYSISGAKGELCFSGASALSGAQLWVSNGVDWFPVNGRSF